MMPSPRRVASLVLAAGLALAGLSPAQAKFETNDASGAIVKVTQSGGDDETDDAASPQGTGFLVSEDGYILTSDQAVLDMPALPPGRGMAAMRMPKSAKVLDEVFVKFDGEDDKIGAKVIERDAEKGLALLKIERDGLDFLKISDFDRVDDTVVHTIAYFLPPPNMTAPEGLQRRDGKIVGSGARDWVDGAYFPVVGYDAELFPGASGSPLLDDCAAVVGLNRIAAGAPSQKSGSEGTETYALDAAQLRPLLDKHDVDYASVDHACHTGLFGQSMDLVREQPLFALLGLVPVLGIVIAAVLLRNSARPARRPGRQPPRSRGDSRPRPAGASESEAAASPPPRQPRTPAAPERPRPERPARKRATPRPGPDRPAPSDEAAWVLAGFLDGDACRFRLAPEEIENPYGLIFGRSPEVSNIVLEENSISRRHFRCYAEDGQLYVEDLGSTNGTAVNGTELEPFKAVRVTAGTTIVAGNLDIRVGREG